MPDAAPTDEFESPTVIAGYDYAPPEEPYVGYPVKLTKVEARRLQKALTMHVDYPDLEPEYQELYDKLEAVL